MAPPAPFEPAVGEGDPWPPEVAPDFTKVTAGVSRTLAPWRDYPPARENEALFLAMIGAARRCIYMENQYFTSPVIAEALAARLAEPEGPQVILISTKHSPSWFDQITMDRTRSNFLLRLRRADPHHRLGAYYPVTEAGALIIVHAKLAVIDDRLLRIGSANVNNRSMGFDSECDLSFEVDGDGDPASAARMAAIRAELVGHWLGCPAAEVVAAEAREAGLVGAIEALRAAGANRLRSIETAPLGPIAALIARYHMGDPAGPGDSWRPWRRRAELEAMVERIRPPVP